MAKRLYRGDVVLVPFPFTDQSGQKIRPAVIVSPDPQHDDMLLAFISSVIPSRLAATDYLLAATHSEFSATGLKKDSVFRAAKLATLQRGLILRRIGRIGPQVQQELNHCLKVAIGL